MALASLFVSFQTKSLRFSVKQCLSSLAFLRNVKPACLSLRIKDENSRSHFKQTFTYCIFSVDQVKNRTKRHCKTSRMRPSEIMPPTANNLRPSSHSSPPHLCPPTPSNSSSLPALHLPLPLPPLSSFSFLPPLQLHDPTGPGVNKFIFLFFFIFILALTSFK